MTIKVGDKIPDATLMKLTEKGPAPVKTIEFFKGRKVAQRGQRRVVVLPLQHGLLPCAAGRDAVGHLRGQHQRGALGHLGEEIRVQHVAGLGGQGQHVDQDLGAGGDGLDGAGAGDDLDPRHGLSARPRRGDHRKAQRRDGAGDRPAHQPVAEHAHRHGGRGGGGFDRAGGAGKCPRRGR